MPKDALGHGSNKRPLAGHPYHAKTDAELRYIQRDASAAAQATRGLSMYNPNSGKREDTEGKYLDQANDASTVLAYRARGGKSDAPADALTSGPKSAPAPIHSAMGGEGYYSRASAKGGRALGNYGPHPTRDAAAAEAYDKHPNAKQVSTSRGPHGFDIQWHRKD